MHLFLLFFHISSLSSSFSSFSSAISALRHLITSCPSPQSPPERDIASQSACSQHSRPPLIATFLPLTSWIRPTIQRPCDYLSSTHAPERTSCCSAFALLSRALLLAISADTRLQVRSTPSALPWDELTLRQSVPSLASWTRPTTPQLCDHLSSVFALLSRALLLTLSIDIRL